MAVPQGHLNHQNIQEWPFLHWGEICNSSTSSYCNGDGDGGGDGDGVGVGDASKSRTAVSNSTSDDLGDKPVQFSSRQAMHHMLRSE